MPEFSPEMVSKLTDYGVRTVGVLVLFIVAIILSRLARSAARKAFERARLEATLAKFFANIIRYLILLVAVLGCLSVFGIETTSFAAILGAAGLAVGLSLQGSLSNFASGVLLLTFRPFKVGDVVNVVGNLGTVDEIELFSTRLITPDNRLLILPNTSIFNNTIENVTAMPTRRVEVKVGVVYGASVDETRRALESAITSVEAVLAEPPSQVMLSELGASSVDWLVRAWVKTEDFWTIREALIRAVKQELAAANIGIPFPQVEVHLDKAIRTAAESAAKKWASQP